MPSKCLKKNIVSWLLAIESACSFSTASKQSFSWMRPFQTSFGIVSNNEICSLLPSPEAAVIFLIGFEKVYIVKCGLEIEISIESTCFQIFTRYILYVPPKTNFCQFGLTWPDAVYVWKEALLFIFYLFLLQFFFSIKQFLLVWMLDISKKAFTMKYSALCRQEGAVFSELVTERCSWLMIELLSEKSPLYYRFASSQNVVLQSATAISYHLLKKRLVIRQLERKR